MICNFPFQAVASQWSEKMCIITALTTPVSWVFLDNDIFSNIKIQSQTPDQVQAPSHSAESRICSRQWYQNIDNKDDMFMAGSPAILTGYSFVVI